MTNQACTDSTGNIVRWKPTDGWKQTSSEGPLLRLCYKDLVAKLSCGVVGPKTFYSQRRQMTPVARQLQGSQLKI